MQRTKSELMKRYSHIISFVLLAVIAVTAQSAAVARTMPDAVGKMVICTGTGPMMVYFDENGDPMGAPQMCPDYALSLIVALGLDNAKIASLGAWFSLRSLEFADAAMVLRLGTPQARGPPVLI